MEGAAALRSPSAPSSMSSSSSRATSRMQSPACVEMSIFVCPRCRAGIDRRVSHTPKNHNRLFYVCDENGHGEWLPMLPRMEVAAARAPEEEAEGEARNDRELAIELRMLKKKVRKLEDQAQIPICNYFWAFVGMVIAPGVMLKLYGKA
ncbi:hypothetical protein ZWY2020_043242 [Hordeum vulgare]|nr:hypothetical protein ZWY2020_043242 [Hordeum vulgare]